MSERRQRAGVALALVAVLAAAGCSSTGAMTDEDAVFATLVVENDATSTVTVYAVREGARMRIGQVTGLTSQEFEIEQRMLTAGSVLRLMIDPIGSARTYLSESISVYRGDIVEFRVSGLIR